MIANKTKESAVSAQTMPDEPDGDGNGGGGGVAQFPPQLDVVIHPFLIKSVFVLLSLIKNSLIRFERQLF